MGGAGLRSLAALAASAIGIAVYLGVFSAKLPWLLIVLAAAVVAGLLTLGIGYQLMGRHPVLAVWLIGAVPVASLAAGAVATFGVVWLGVLIRDALDHLPRAENDTLIESVTPVVTGIAGALILNSLGNQVSWLWPRRHVQAAFGRCFTRRWKSGTPAADAIFEVNVLGVTPVIRGWGWRSRLRRAAVIARAVGGDGTPPFVPVAGPARRQPGS